jgi:ring-1,2-phenylacetyl-CoA epoxidase subunit PaaE
VAIHFWKLKIADVHRETADCVSLVFEVPKGLEEIFQFRQGQSISVKTIIDGEEVRRSYSICSSPLDNELRVAVKRVDSGKFSTLANRDLKAGSEIEVLPPIGSFFTELNPAQAKNYLAFAAGSGITPLLSIIKTTLAIEPRSNFTLIYGNRNRQSIIFREQLEGLKNRYMGRLAVHYVLSREKTDAQIYRGHIDGKKCQELAGKILFPLQADEIFICGPEAMLSSLRLWLEDQGVDPKKIHFERFNAPEQGLAALNSGSKPPDSGTSRVTLRIDGVSVEFGLARNGLSILEAALDQGIDLPFACKSGVCCSCRARLLEGKVSMDVNYGLEPEELSVGYILTCQSHPLTESLLVDFDQK